MYSKGNMTQNYFENFFLSFKEWFIRCEQRNLKDRKIIFKQENELKGWRNFINKYSCDPNNDEVVVLSILINSNVPNKQKSNKYIKTCDFILCF